MRARKTLGDGSDLGRIERQQAFLSSVVQEATRTSLLLRPDKLFGFLDAATSSLTTDEDFDLGTMKDLASSVGRHRHVKNVQFITVPVQEYPADPNRVEWAPSAEVLWQTLRDDGVVGAKPSAAPVRLGRAAHREPDGGRGRGRQRHRACRGSPREVAAALEVQGFPDVDHGQLRRRGRTAWSWSTAPVAEEAARTVAAAFEGATLREDASVTSGVRVVLGAGAPAVQEVPNRTGSSPVPTPSVSAPSPVADPHDHDPHGRPGHLLLIRVRPSPGGFGAGYRAVLVVIAATPAR